MLLILCCKPNVDSVCNILGSYGIVASSKLCDPAPLYGLNFISKVLFGNAYTYLGEYVINFILLRDYHTSSSISSGWHNTKSERYQSFFRNMKTQLRQRKTDYLVVYVH